MLEIGKVEYLQVEAIDTGLPPLFHLLRSLFGNAGNSVLAQFVGLASDRCCSTNVLGLITANGNGEGG